MDTKPKPPNKCNNFEEIRPKWCVCLVRRRKLLKIRKKKELIVENDIHILYICKISEKENGNFVM